jgi:hypothetical protein
MGLRNFIHRLTAPKPLRSMSLDEKLKMVFIVNHELKMGKGKIAAHLRVENKTLLFSTLGSKLVRRRYV